MATERQDFEIGVRLDITNLQANSQAALREVQALNRALETANSTYRAPGTAEAFGRSAEAINLRDMQQKLIKAQAALDEFRKTDRARAAQQYIDYEPPRVRPGQFGNVGEITKAGKAEQDRLKRLAGGDKGIEELAKLESDLNRSLVAALRANRNYTKALQASEKVAFENSDYAKDLAALSKLRLDRARALDAMEAQVRREKLAAERDSATAARQLANQTRRGQAQLAAQEFNQRNNPLNRPLEDYLNPLGGGGIHEPNVSATRLATAQSKLLAAQERVTAIYQAAGAGHLSEEQATRQMRSAQERLTAAYQAEASARSRLSSESGGFIGQFTRGFKGASDRPYAEQLGQAVKFSAFYGAAYRIQFALLQTFRDALTQGIEFEQGLSDMALATGRSKSSLGDLADSLAEISANAGASPSAGVEIGARAIGLYGKSEANAGVQDYVARLSTEVVSKLALGSKTDPVTLQQNLAAITQALRLGAAGQLRVADLDAYFSKRFGVASGSTLESGAQSSSVGIAAGFSLEEIQAAAALLISRTGQTSSAVGGYLAQIFSRGGEGSLTNVASKYGVQTSGRELADVFSDLAKVYRNSSSTVQSEISAAFGRGKVQNAVVSLLQDFEEVGKAAKEAQGGAATGALDRSFNERINNIGGQIAILGSHFKEFARLLGQSGFLSVLGLAVTVLDEFLQVTNSVLRAFNELPGTLRTVIGLMLAYAAAQRLGITGAVGGAIASRYQYGLEAAAAGGATGLRGVGIAAAKAIGPFAVATGALIAIGALHDSAKRQKQALDDANEAFHSKDAPTSASDATAFSSRGDELDALATQNREATGRLAKILSLGTADNANLNVADALEEEAERVRKVAARLRAEADTLTPSQRTFSSLDDDGLTAGLKGITESGGTAVDQMNALIGAMNGLGEAAKKNKGVIEPDLIATDFGNDIHKILKDVVLNAGPENDPGVKPGSKYDRESAFTYPAGKLEGRVREQLSPTVVQERLTKALKERGVTTLDELTPEQIDAVAAEVTKLDPDKRGKNGGLGLGAVLPPSGLKKLQGVVTNHLADILKAQVKAFDEITSGSGPLSTTQALALANNAVDATEARTNLRDKSDFKGRIGDQRKLIAGLRRTAARTPQGEELNQIQLFIAQARQTLVQNAVSELEEMRHAAVSNAKSQAEATKIGRGFVNREIRAVVRGGGTRDDLIGVLSTAGRGAIAIARNEINHALKIAEAALQTRLALNKAAATLSKALGPLGESLYGAFGGNDAEAKDTQAEIDRLQGLAAGLNYVTPDANPDQLPKGSKEDQETAAQRRAARLAAAAAKRGGEIGPARAALYGAQVELNEAKKGTVAYYNALASYYQAQDALTDAIRSYGRIRAELKIDTTDPVATALLDLRVARNKLLSDQRKGKAPDVIAQDRLDLKNAQNAAEAAKFDQRLSDIQTAESLGQITHTAYLRYLQSEHNRLASINKRTRQQQDELNQIDQLLKDAQNELQGQFNIGDIKLPTPYEVRRYLQAQVAGLTPGVSANAGGTTTIYIDGADTAKVKAIIDDTVGKSTRVLTTTTRRS